MNTDRISDLTTRIRNAYLAHKDTVGIPHTVLIERIVQVLVEEKYLGSYEVVGEGVEKSISATLLYSGHTPAISDIKRVSKPGVRMYSRVKALRPVLSGMGIAVLSTSQGIMTDRAAKKLKIGGEVLFELW
jgi:small subunit ribosomal protein S8